MAVVFLNSLRKRFVLTALILLGLSVAIFSYIESTLIRSSEDTPQVVHQHQALAGSVESMRISLRRLESAIYQYTVLLDFDSREEVTNCLYELKSNLAMIDNNNLLAQYKRLQHSIASLKEIDKLLENEIAGLIQILGSYDKRFPSATVMKDVLSPTHAAFTQELQLAISDTDAEKENPHVKDFDTKAILTQLRYYWMQQISTVRSFVANRTGIFDKPVEKMRRNIRDREIYSKLIDEDLKDLSAIDKENGLSIQQSISLERMMNYKHVYDDGFNKIKTSYMSDNWRTDYPLLKQKIHPLFVKAWSYINQLDSDLQSRNTKEQLSLYGKTYKLQGLIWLFNIAALVVVLIAYASFEFLMRRPVMQMALAMKAHAVGKDYHPDIHTNIAENRELLTAFNLMKKEVDTRQKKLESILDNAAEGIITFDAQGKIVNFNKAAERLFFVDSDTAVGKGVNTYVPGLIDEQRCLDYSADDSLHIDDMVIEIPRNHHEKFIASIKISKMVLEGREYFTALISDISEQVEMLNNLKRVAEHDSLTGLFNRKYLLERLDGLIEEKQDQKIALLYIDLDNFKFANDTLGHLAGDQILIEVTRLLGSHMRDNDLLARLGGDEFAIILHDVDEELAVTAANDFRLSIAAYHFVHAGKTIDIGCSIGIAMMNDDILRTEELLAKADYACHVAKTKGRNMVHLYHFDDRREVAAIYADMGWTRIIKRAIENDRFFLVSQPIIDSISQEEFAREVLIRLNDQNSTIAMPSGFIPAAERFGLMPDIDRWVISRTIGYLQEDVIQGRESRYSINLSAATFNDQATLDYIRYLIEHSGVSAENLIFEITETMAITHMESASKTLEGLRALGCQTALDDFGAGHASYLYLKDLPVDYVKIDGSFIKDLLKEPLHMAMVRSMKEVADAVGIRTIAEYVEDKATMEVLRAAGIDYLQGYYLGRPKPMSNGSEEGRLGTSI